MKLFILKKLAALGLGVILEHKEFLISTSSMVLNWWKGKKIAIVGPNNSGKDSLWQKLMSKDSNSVQSFDGKIPTFKINFKLSDGRRLNLTCKRSINIGGEQLMREHSDGWRKVCDDSDIIFYLIDIDDLLSKNYINSRIEDDLKWFFRTLPFLKNNAVLHILINKVDKKINSYTEYEAYEESIKSELAEFNQNVIKSLSKWSKAYTGSTLISTYNDEIYLVGIENVFNRIFHHLHQDKK